MNTKIDEEEPLDPVMERVRVKMVRLLGISIGLMLLALITVLGAVVYKISQGSSEDAETQSTAPVGTQHSLLPMLETVEFLLPEGAEIRSSSLAGNRLLLELQLPGDSKEFWVLDLASGKIASKVSIR
jgi:hypothetical protein